MIVDEQWVMAGVEIFFQKNPPGWPFCRSKFACIGDELPSADTHAATNPCPPRSETNPKNTQSCSEK